MIATIEAGTRRPSHALILTTLGDLVSADGEGTLPHGLLKPDGSPTTFRLHPPTMGTRKRLGALAADKALKNKPGEHTAHWLATALVELDGQALAGLKRGEAAALVARLTVGDVMTLLFAWQLVSNPRGLPLDAHGCGTCGEGFDSITVDLGTLEIMRLPRAGDAESAEAPAAGALTPPTSTNPPTCTLGLHRGLPYPSPEQPARTVLLGPPTWAGTFFRLGSGQLNNREVLHAYVVGDAIRGLDSCPALRVPQTAIDELWPDDMAAIDEALGEITPTAVLQVDVTCPKCSARNLTDLDWMDPSFFTRSSRA